MFKLRIKKLRDRLQEKGLDSFLVTNLVNIRYLTGFSGSAGILLVTHRRVILITDSRYTIQAREEAPLAEVFECTKPLLTLKKHLKKIRPKKLAYEKETITLSLYRKLSALLKETANIRPVASRNIVEEGRRIKDEGEIEKICLAVRVAEDAFCEIRKMIRPGIRESDLALELEYQMRRHGAQKAAFDTIVASGSRSALPHAIASERIIGENELVVIDFGASVDGYHSDMTRSLITGQGTSEQKKIHRIVRQAQDKALALVREGVRAKQVDQGARDHIDSCGYGSAFGHGTGHGIGLEVHEGPRINQHDSTVLKAGHTFTIEPGIYLKDIGGVRIEDMVTVTGDGCRILTGLSREPVVTG